MNNLTKNTLTFIAGYCDTVTFICMGGIFSAHVTGNFVLFAAAIAQGLEPHDWIKILTFPVFVIAVVIATILYHALSKSLGNRAYKSLLWAMAILLICASGMAFLEYQFMNIAATMTVVLALGIQNTVHHFIPGPMTTVMTGMVMNTTARLTERYMAPAGKSLEATKGPELPGLLMIVSFLAGCVCAGFASASFGLKSLCFVAVLMAVVLVLEGKNRSKND